MHLGLPSFDNWIRCRLCKRINPKARWFAHNNTQTVILALTLLSLLSFAATFELDLENLPSFVKRVYSIYKIFWVNNIQLSKQVLYNFPVLFALSTALVLLLTLYNFILRCLRFSRTTYPSKIVYGQFVYLLSNMF